jgi:uncharacterized sulfatase
MRPSAEAAAVETVGENTAWLPAPTDIVWLPEYFHQNGYFTAAIGKVTHSYGVTTELIDWDLRELRPELDPAQVTDNDLKHTDGRTARKVVSLLGEHQDEPFFIAAGFWKPHPPFVSPSKYRALYDHRKIPLPDEPASHIEQIPPIALRNGNPRGSGNPHPSELSNEQKREEIADYFACISFIDAQLGLMLDALDRLGLTEKTVVVFFGDHGRHLFEHGGLTGKRSLFQESSRTPLIVSAPGKAGGTDSPRLVELVDLYPTLAELCNLPSPPGVEGTSFAPLMDDPMRLWKQGAFSVVRRKGEPSGRAVYNERYAYVEWGGEQTAQLYDHQTDPNEHINLINFPEHAQTAARMHDLLSGGWQKAVP